MASRITEIRDALADWLEASWEGDDPVPATVHKSLPRIDADAITGRHVWLYRGGQSDGGPSTKTEHDTDYRIVVQVNERYEGTEAQPPEAWIDERLDWVAENVWDFLGLIGERDDEGAGFPATLATVWVETRDWPDSFDPDMLTEHSVFEANIVLVVRESA